MKIANNIEIFGRINDNNLVDVLTVNNGECVSGLELYSDGIIDSIAETENNDTDQQCVITRSYAKKIGLELE